MWFIYRQKKIGIAIDCLQLFKYNERHHCAVCTKRGNTPLHFKKEMIVFASFHFVLFVLLRFKHLFCMPSNDALSLCDYH